jgi:hypothetical protein
MEQFLADAFEAAKRLRKNALPPGVFESIWCFAVAIADSVDEETIHAIESIDPPIHVAAAEIPVIFDRANNRLSSFDGTPLWGYLFWAGLRKELWSLLSPTDAVGPATRQFQASGGGAALAPPTHPDAAALQQVGRKLPGQPRLEGPRSLQFLPLSLAV